MKWLAGSGSVILNYESESLLFYQSFKDIIGKKLNILSKFLYYLFDNIFFSVATKVSKQDSDAVGFVKIYIVVIIIVTKFRVDIDFKNIGLPDPDP
jgi:hypothetical protein